MAAWGQRARSAATIGAATGLASLGWAATALAQSIDVRATFGVITAAVLLALASLLVMTYLGAPVVRSVSLAQARARLRGRLDVLRARAYEKRRAAERAQRAKEEFLAAVSHELRTPLNSIRGFAEVLLAELEGPLTESQREDAQAIHDAGAYLKELVDEVLDASSSRTPTAAKLEPIHLGALVREVARLVEVQRRDKPIAVEVEVDPELPLVPVDARRIRQILLNLGGNAVKFTRRGHVRFKVRKAGDGVRIAVEDTGPGIPREDLERIFRTFERVDTNRGRTEGWGLGLAIARDMAHWHSGKIEVESVVGRGSTFALVLPSNPVLASSEPPPAPKRRSSTSQSEAS